MDNKKVDMGSIELDQINMNDYPDFSDAYVCYAEWEDGTPLTEEELEQEFNSKPEVVHPLVMERIY